MHDFCQLTDYCLFDHAHARESMFSFKPLLNSVAVIERYRLTQTNDAELKMKNDKLDLIKKKKSMLWLWEPNYVNVASAAAIIVCPQKCLH